MENFKQHIPNLHVSGVVKTWHDDYYPNVLSDMRKDNIFMLILEHYNAPDRLDINDQPDITIIDNAIITERSCFEHATSAKSYYQNVVNEIGRLQQATKEYARKVFESLPDAIAPTIHKAWYNVIDKYERKRIVIRILKTMYPKAIYRNKISNDNIESARVLEAEMFEASDSKNLYHRRLFKWISNIGEEIYNNHIKHLTALARLNQEPCHGGNSCIIEKGQVYMLYEANGPIFYHRIPICVNCFVKQPDDRVKTWDNPEIFVKKENFKLKLNKVPSMSYYDPSMYNKT